MRLVVKSEYMLICFKRVRLDCVKFVAIERESACKATIGVRCRVRAYKQPTELPRDGLGPAPQELLSNATMHYGAKCES